MKRTSLYERHKAAGATLVPFAGWEMPVSYAGTVSEVAAVRSDAGLFDVSHMGEVRVSGQDASAFLQYVTANDISKLRPGKAQYSLLLNEGGGVIDDIIVYRLARDEFLIVVNAGCKDKDWEWLRAQAESFPSVTLRDESDETALLAVQGPEAVAKVAPLLMTDPRAETPKRFHFAQRTLLNIPCLLSRTGYTGEDGYELFCPWDDAPALWDALVAAGCQPAGLGARDVLRLEAAYPLYGHELDAETSPLESGVGWAVKPAKGDFIGRDAVEARLARGLQQQLAGLRMDERAIPRERYPVLDPAGSSAGQVTSGTFSPTVKAGIALARLDVAQARPGSRVVVDIRGRRAGATVVELPFYRNGV